MAKEQQSQSQPTVPLRRGPGQPGGRIEKPKNARNALKRLAGYLKPFKWGVAAVLFLVLVYTLLGLAGPILMGRAIDRYISIKDLAGLWQLALQMVAIYLLSAAAQVLEGIIMANISQSLLRRLRTELFARLQTLSLAYHDKHPHGELMSRLTNDIDAINRVLTGQITQLFGGLLSLGGIIIAMFLLNVWMALASMIVLPLMLGLVGWVGKRTRGEFRKLQKSIGALNGQFEEMYSGQRVVIAFGQQGHVLSDFDESNDQVRSIGTRAQSIAMIVPPLMGIMSNSNIAVIAGLGGWLILQGGATVGVIASFVSYSRRFAQPLRQLGDLYNQIQSALAGAERVFEIIDTEPELLDAPNASDLSDIKGEVVFDHVRFEYEPGVPVIKDMSLRAAPGETVAFVGPTGAGKTTMINLLSRFYDVQEGTVTIDGHDTRQVKKDSLRSQLGIVLQDTFLFSETVMENIRYGRLEATDEEVIAAAKLANAHQFIRHLPEGYQTPLGERGSNLSQGQRQMLAIARAVLADPKILILDEATSSVDTRTEMHIQEAMLKLMEGRTSFVIAHRLSTIRDADMVLVVNEGEIIERGTHDELLAQGGFYHDLYMSQFRGQALTDSQH